MKQLTLLSLFALAAFARAETTITLNGVHNCCRGCANGITKAAADFKDVTVTPAGKKVTITTKKKSDAKKVAEAIIAAGYYGTIEGDESADKKPATASKPESKVAKATVSGVHLCCQKCADAATDAVKAVAGVTKYDIVSKSESFTVEGEFAKADLVAALNSAGFAGDIK
ncbi:MAG TPA: hypothetical protein DDZ88_16905 [Verrucomicrobiales bacterium]|nr:hypothetical protein [Verrucomicrobiales bacterium]